MCCWLKQTVQRKNAIQIIFVFGNHRLAAKNKHKIVVFKHIQWICGFSECEQHYLLIVLCDLWSFTNVLRHHLLRHLLHQTLKQTQNIFVFIHIFLKYVILELKYLSVIKSVFLLIQSALLLLPWRLFERTLFSSHNRGYQSSDGLMSLHCLEK